MDDYELYFKRNDKDTWAMARLHHSLLKQIENSPAWEKEEVPDIPLSEEQMVIFTKGYDPSWEARYAPYLLGGWYYLTRSGWWVKKLKYEKKADGFYHVTEHFTSPKEKGHNVLAQVIVEGHFYPEILDDRLRDLMRTIEILPQSLQ